MQEAPPGAGFRPFALALAGACALSTLHPVHEPDAFWHLTLGRAVLAHGSRTVPEPSAFADFAQQVTVPEWLWGIATFLLHQIGGWPLLSVFCAALAFVAALASARLVAVEAPRAPRAALVLVATLVLVLVSSRLRLRPQVAFLALLPTAILLARRYAAAEGDARRRPAVWLLGLEVLWAQVHGSFVLGPAVFALCVAPAWLRRPTARDALAHGALLAGLLLALFTSAHGLGTVGYVLAHGGGDAARHVEDLHPPDWAALNPISHPFAAAYLALWAIALAGALAARRVELASLGLAALGVALLATANRFFAAGGILLIPLAAQGVAALAAAFPRPRAWLPVAACTALGLLGPWTASTLAAHYGPLGRLGPAEGVHPRETAQWLRGAADGSRILSSFVAGAPLGFWLAGRVRTYVDPRTPLHFDAADFAVARDVFTHADALARALVRYRVDAVVVERDRPGCANLQSVGAGFAPIVVEARYTAFAPPAPGQALEVVQACGPRYLPEEACRDGGAALERDLARLARLGESPFLAYLRAEHALRCGGRAAVAAELLPEPRDARAFDASRARLAGAIELAGRRIDAAVATLAPLARAGDLEAVNLLGAALAGDPARVGELREILEDAIGRASDHASPELRANLALLCMRENDAECVRFQGVRAAARGSTRAAEPLRWLAAHHPDPRIRRDAGLWLVTLAGHGSEHAFR